jgi:PST family polysaccharide transporter
VLWFIPQAQGYEMLFYLTMWLCLYDFIFPIWYFQGIEQMKYITYLTLVSRLFFFCMIFLVIKSPDDYLLMPIINGIGALIAGVLSLFIIFTKHRILFKWQPLKVLKKYVIDSVPIFLSNVSIRFFVSTNKVVLGAFMGMAEVSYYDLGEKIVSIAKIPQTLFGQTLFPKINKDKNISFIKKAFKISIIFNFLLFIGVIVLSKYAVLFLGGEKMTPAIWIINILALSVPIIAMSNIFGVQLLIPFGKLKLFSQIIVSSGFVYLIQLLMIWIVWDINIYSVSIITVTTEVVVTATMFYFCKKHKLW